VRDADAGDVAAICRFGDVHIPPHFTRWSARRLPTSRSAGGGTRR